jgi:glycosyltransferase involved in cell wall biosynthesis
VRIGLITPRYAPVVGGVEKHVERLAQYLVGRGHDAEVLTQTGDRKAAAVEQVDGVTVRRFPLAVRRADYEFAPGLARFLRADPHRYEVVHGHNYHALPATAAAWSRPRSFVFTPHYHGTSASAFRRLLHIPYRRIGGSVIRRADRVICVSQREEHLVRRDFPWVGDTIEVIHNGVDLGQIRAAQPYPETRRVILSAGRLETYKGVDRTITAMQHLSDDFILRITGDGPARAELMELVDRLGLSHRVEFLGRIDLDSLYRWFRTASVYVTMSRIEAMPLTPLEVLAAGATVVASDIAAHREVADATGASVKLISPVSPPGELAAAIAEASDEPARAPDVLDWTDVGDRTLAVYVAATRATNRVQP